MRKKYSIPVLLLGFLLVAGTSFAGSYAPAAGVDGSTAIHMDDPGFVAWATGWENLTYGTGVDDTWKTPGKALGKAAGTSADIVCLGNGGSITMTFDTPIVNGTGSDFAVFENSFNDTFLELAYVEVSADGTNWYRFANDSQTSGPVDSYAMDHPMDASNIDGLAGKYRQGYGTPFDLANLGLPEISYVRILDIIGDGTYLDTSGDVIYDPYPTTGSGGFDLDAVGVLHQSPVPVPGAVWLLGSGLLGLFGVRRRTRKG